MSLLARRRTVIVALATALVMLVGVSFLSYRNTQSLIEATRWREHTEQVIAEIHATLACMAEAETGMRGFVITGDERMLEPHASFTADIEDHLARLRALTADNPNQVTHLSTLTPLAQEKLDFMAHGIEARREQGSAAAAAQVATLQGKRIMDGIRELLSAMEQEEIALRAKRALEVESSVARSNLLLLSGTVASLGVLILVFTALAREIRERSRAEADTESSRVFLDSVIENIPNMVFVKDAETLRFVRMNKAGERLLGLSRDELIGKSDFNFFPEEQAAFFAEKDRAVLQKKVLFDIPEEPLTTTALGERVLHTKKVPILDASGRPRYLLGISEDITQVKERQREVETLNRTVISQLGQLEIANRRLEAANHELEAFSYSVSHDLRAPLRHVIGFSDLLGEIPMTDPAAHQYAVKISGAASRMGALIEDLLLFSRMGRKEMQSLRVPLGPLVRRVIEDFHLDAAKRDIEWTIEDLPEVRGDPAMLEQVLTNLIENAIKYTTPRDIARIEVGSVEDAGETVVFVRDNGVGFDSKYAHKLFGVFQRLHDRKEFEGTGIGLANVRRIVSRHGGRTWAEGDVGHGATFYFSLPGNKEVFDATHIEAGAACG